MCYVWGRWDDLQDLGGPSSDLLTTLRGSGGPCHPGDHDFWGYQRQNHGAVGCQCLLWATRKFHFVFSRIYQNKALEGFRRWVSFEKMCGSLTFRAFLLTWWVSFEKQLGISGGFGLVGGFFDGKWSGNEDPMRYTSQTGSTWVFISNMQFVWGRQFKNS